MKYKVTFLMIRIYCMLIFVKQDKPNEFIYFMFVFYGG